MLAGTASLIGGPQHASLYLGSAAQGDAAPIAGAIAITLVVAGVIVLAAVLVRARRRREYVAARPLSFTPHARERMKERDVSESEVAQAVARPDRVVSATYLDQRDRLRRGTWSEPQTRESVRLEKDYDRKTLKVWLPPSWETDPAAVVKSVAWQHFDSSVVPTSKVGQVIGRNGQTIRSIEQRFDVRVDVDKGSGAIRIQGDDERSTALAAAEIRAIAR